VDRVHSAFSLKEIPVRVQSSRKLFHPAGLAVLTQKAVESPSLEIFQPRLDAVLCSLGDPASAGGLGWVTHRGPFQPRPFCDTGLQGSRSGVGLAGVAAGRALGRCSRS